MRSFLDLTGGFFWYKIGINRFCVDLSKYWANKEKDHNILWSEWYSRRESNPQRPLRRGLLYPFNYGSILNFIAQNEKERSKKFYTKIYTKFFPSRKKRRKYRAFAPKPCI